MWGRKQKDDSSYWREETLPGLQRHTRRKAAIPTGEIKKGLGMKVLELFSGTASFSKAAKENGYETFTIDKDKKFNPSLCMDVLELKSSDIPFKPDIIWASPPCEQYSHAKRRGIRKLDEADKCVQKTIEFIKQLEPKFWFIENPQTGLLKKRQVMSCLGSLFSVPYKDVSYCKYGLPYRKQTRIWTNCYAWKPRAICKKDCKFIREGKHIMSVGNARKKYTLRPIPLTEKYSVPNALCMEILESIKKIE